MNIILGSTKTDQKTFRGLSVGSIFSLDECPSWDKKKFYMKIGGGFSVNLSHPAHKLSFAGHVPVTEYKATLKLEEM